MQNEKPVVSATGRLDYLNHQRTMKNCNPTDEKTQPNLNFGSQPKVFEIINCGNCRKERELDGYIFRLVAVCADCRTASEVQITRKRFERRRANR